MRCKSNTRMPKVSVIVPTFNRPESLREAIVSIMGQTFQDFEVIVVNDCGVDVRGVMASFGTEKLTYLRHEVNKGLAATRNTGIRAAKGKYIAYLDDDDIYYPDHLKTLVDFLESGDHKIAYADTFRALQVLEKGAYAIKRKDLMSFDFDPDRLLLNNLTAVHTVMHEKAIFDEVGLFDESLRCLEDWDLWIRISRKYEFGHIKKITSEYRWRLDGSNMTSSKQMEFVKTRERIYEKYRSWAAADPKILEMQRKIVQSETMHAGKGNWAKKEKLKLFIIKIIGIRGLDILYRLKLKLF